MEVVSRVEAKRLGLKRYFTGRPCLRGHIAPRWTSNSDCEVCRHEGRKDRYANEQGPAKAAASKWYWDNHQRAKDTRRAFWARHPGANAKRSKAWRLLNLERFKMVSLKWKLANRDKRYAAIARWEAKNPEAKPARVRNRRARLKQAAGCHTGQDVRDLLRKQRGKCANCYIRIAFGYHVDHIQPLSVGGSNDVANLQLLCATCNRRKWAKDPIRWAQENGRLV